MHLYALILIPVLVLFFYFRRRQRARALARFGDAELVGRLMPQVSRLKHPLKFGILMLVFALLTVAWANPQWGTTRERVKVRASDIFIALDVSNSMLANDIKPNRLERARAFALDLVNALKGERIGILVFAGNAYVQMPRTTDYAAAMMQLKTADPSQLPTQGTALADVINLAERDFPADAQKRKVLIIISDGEDQDSDALTRARVARENGLLIFTIGVGTADGAPMPMDFGGVPDFKRDERGQPIISKLNEQMLRDLAAAGEGDYFNIVNTSGVIEALKNRVEKVEKRELAVRSVSDWASQFQWLAAAGLLILVVEFMMPYRRSGWEGRDIFQ